MIGPHIFCYPTTSTHLSWRQVTPPMTSQMIMGPTACWRDITAYQKRNGRDSMEPWSLLLPTWTLFLWRCGIHFNNNQPVSSLMPFKNEAPATCTTWSRHQHPSMSSSNPNAIRGDKSEEIEEIARASMALVAVDVIKTIDPMVILRARGGSVKEPPYSRCSLWYFPPKDNSPHSRN